EIVVAAAAAELLAVAWQLLVQVGRLGGVADERGFGAFEMRGFLRRQCTTTVLSGPFQGSDRRAGPHPLQIRLTVCRARRTPWWLLSNGIGTEQSAQHDEHSRVHETPVGQASA